MAEKVVEVSRSIIKALVRRSCSSSARTGSQTFADIDNGLEQQMALQSSHGLDTGEIGDLTGEKERQWLYSGTTFVPTFKTH